MVKWTLGILDGGGVYDDCLCAGLCSFLDLVNFLAVKTVTNIMCLVVIIL